MKSKSQKADYRDDPDAVSLHTTPDDIPYTDDAPTHAGDSSSSSASAPPNYEDTVYYIDPDRTRFDYNGLNPRDSHFSTISKQAGKRASIAGEHVRIQNPHADTHPEYLEEWVEYMARQAPSPYIVVTGTHWEEQYDSNEKKKQRVNVTDFQIRISMRNYLWPNFRVNDPSLMELVTVSNGRKTWRGTVFKKRAPGAIGDIEVGDDRPSLREWCHRYCASMSRTRIFRLTRTVVGLDEEYISNRLAGMIRATNYRGHIDVSFPVADRAVDIYSKSLLNDWRLTTWIRWVFYLTFLWIFAWPILYFSTKRYHIITAAWPFSQIGANNTQIYTTVTEEQWVDKYGPAVRQLARDRYDGVVGDDMLNQVLERPETHRPVPAEFPGAQADGRAALTAGAGAFLGGFNVANRVNSALRFAGGSNDQVGWGYDR